MTETKFRAWDQSTKSFFKGFPKFKIEGDEKQATFSFVDVPCIKVMQFAGFTDKNGDEIYEGDLVSIYDPYIEIQDGVQIAELPENRFEQIKWDIGAWMCGGEMLREEASHCEIFCNIYENPELLDAVK